MDLTSQFRRKPVHFSGPELVQCKPLMDGCAIPVQVSPSVPGLDLLEWAGTRRPEINRLVREHKALLFRGFHAQDGSQFEEFTRLANTGEPLEYKDRTTPRTKLGNSLYTSTIYPADRKIALHNEGTYWVRWPLKICFGCLKASEQGGETPIADTEKILAKLGPEVVRHFRETGFLLERNYNEGFGLAWQEVFQTENKQEVEEYCRKNRVEFEWREGDRLRTRQVRPAIRRNPRTGKEVWFNHAAFFHWSSYPAEVFQMMEQELGRDNLPYKTFYGDGTEIPPEIIAKVHKAYDAEEVAFRWQHGDVLLLDNMSIAHGRRPYTGERLIGVAMYEACEDENA